MDTTKPIKCETVKSFKSEVNGKRMTIICTNNETREEVEKCIKLKFGNEAVLVKL